MGNNFVSVRIAALSTSEAVGQAAHDTRHRAPAYLRTAPDAPTTFPLPSGERVVIEGEQAWAVAEPLVRQWAQDLAVDYESAHGRAWPRNAKGFLGIIITFSEGGIQGVEREDLNHAARAYLERLERELGVRVLYVSEHADEKVLHYQALVTNYDVQNHASVKNRLGRPGLRKIQDWAGEAFAHLGLERGRRREGTGARHYSVAEGHRREQVQLEAETQHLREERDRARREAEGFRRDLERAHRNYDTVLDRLGALDQAYQDLQGEIARKKQVLSRIQESITQSLQDLRNLVRQGIEDMRRAVEAYDRQRQDDPWER